MKRKLSLTILFVLLIGGGSLWALTAYYEDLPNRISQHETVILGQSHLVPGSQAALRVVVRDTKDTSPLENAEIKISMKPAAGGSETPVYKGQTNAGGTADVSFKVPESIDPDQILVIETKSDLGSDFVERSVSVKRDYRILLTTDKPLYQPGQEIHIRALALSTFDLIPASNTNMEIVIADGKGNKVFRETALTSDFGVASIDFQLANQVNTGPYKITANLDNTTSEKTVTVERYVLPKFEISIDTERSFYMPGERVEGSLDAIYFFGKPVSGGEVQIEGYTYDVEQNTTFTIQGTTDADGHFEYAFEIPGYIAGSDFEGGLGRYYLQASVTDLAKHTEISNTSLPVASTSLIIDAVPEGGFFRPGVENILYVITTYPDGSPAETTIDIEFYNNGQRFSTQTGSFGIAEVRIVADSPYQDIFINAQDAAGATSGKEFYFEGDWYGETVLIRPDRPVYRVGETMNLTVLASQPQGTVYIDIIREGQTINTRAVDLTVGNAQVAVDLSPDLYGTLQIHAYKISNSGNIIRDTRLVVVDNANDLNLALTPDQEIFMPGEQAGVNIHVTGQDGSGVQVAVGLAVVDESVFALAEQDPGFAKLYFLLEQELLQPKYDLHGFSIPDLVSRVPISQIDTYQAVEEVAMASLSEAAPQGPAFTLQANSHDEAVNRAHEQQEKYFSNLSKGSFPFTILTLLIIAILSVNAVIKAKNLGRSILLSIGFIGGLFIILWWVNFLFRDFPSDSFLLILGTLTPLSLLSLILYAWRKKDSRLGWIIGLMILFIANFALTFYAIEQGGESPGEAITILFLFAFLLIPAVFILRGASYFLQRKYFPGVSAAFVGVFLVTASLLYIASTPMMFSGRMNMPVEEEMFFRADMAIEEPEAANAVLEGAALDNAEKTTHETGSADEQAGSSTAPPRLRQFFPETMLWIPDAVTQPDGTLHLDFQAADSITTWRMTALASTQDGRLGSAIGALKVFQDFFIDLDLPLALTVGDEVAVPVGVFNYLTVPQTVRLELKQEPWFKLLDQAEKTIEIGPNDITVEYFRIKALNFGHQPFQVTAWGSQMSDAVLKEVRVYPDGKQLRFTQSDRLNPDNPVTQVVSIPLDAIPGTQQLLVKIYPGIVSQVVEGLDSILRMPYGCFEQTSSTTYPNVLVLDYLKTTNQAAPEVQFKAEDYINLGYQRLTTFEVAGSGGFSLFGSPPPDRMLTAYGLQEFTDMSKVHNVDPDLIERAAKWVFSEQNNDGTWENDQGLVHENTWSNLKDDRLPVTAYIVWSLVDAGFGNDQHTQNALGYIREFQSNAEDAYVLALVVNALVAADISEGVSLSSSTRAVLDRLASMAEKDGSGVYWSSGVATFMGSEGKTGSIETTALAALAFIRANAYPDLANAALTFLIQQKDSYGTWYSTQATVLALKALIQSVRAGAESVNASVTVSLNKGQTRTVQVTPENFDVVQLLTFDDINIGTENVVELSVQGEGNLMYQVAGEYYLPWDKLGIYPEVVESKELVQIDLSYDRTELSVDDTVQVNVSVALNEPGSQADWALIDLGLPPGFTVETADLAALVARFDDIPKDYAFPTIERYELTGRQILVYIGNLSADHPLTFSYRLRAKYPLTAQTPASTAYDYYNPDVSGEAAPQILVVVP